MTWKEPHHGICRGVVAPSSMGPQEFDQGHDFVSVQIKNTAVGQNVLTN